MRWYVGLSSSAFVALLSGCGADARDGEQGVAIVSAPSDAPLLAAVGQPRSLAVAAAGSGRLQQMEPGGAITYTTRLGWRIRVEAGSLTIKPRLADAQDRYQYVSSGPQESLGTTPLRRWATGRRTIILSGNAKITMHTRDGALARISIYDGASIYRLDASTQRILAQYEDQQWLKNREDAAEHDGETAHLFASITRNEAGTYVNWLYLANLYLEQPGTLLSVRPRPLGEQYADRVRPLLDERGALPEDNETGCAPTGEMTGGLSRITYSKALQYSTRGGWRILYERGVNAQWGRVVIFSPKNFSYEATIYEYMSYLSYYVQNWNGLVRTMILGDGTKITMTANPNLRGITKISIFDGARVHQVTGDTAQIGGEVTLSCVNSAISREKDDLEADGEAGYIVDYESSVDENKRVLVADIYDEEAKTSGAGLLRQYNFVPLASYFYGPKGSTYLARYSSDILPP